MDNFKFTISERTIDFMENCEHAKEAWKFEIINSSLLLEQLAFNSNSGLGEFLLGEGMKRLDDLEEEAMQVASDRKGEEQIISNKDKIKGREDENIVSYCENKLDLHDKDDKLYQYIVDDDVLEIFMQTFKLCKDNNVSIIEPIHIMAGMVETEDDDFKTILDNLGVSYSKARAYFIDGKVFKTGIIPMSISSFMFCMNDKVDVTKPCEILMRDKEVEQIWNISMKKNKRNTIVVGEAGVGKSALIEKMTYDIVNKTCPEKFKGFYVINLDVNSLIADTTYRGQAEKRIKDLIEFLEKRNDVILFIDEVHTILGAGACRDGEMDLANALKPILARGDTIVIGATTNKEYEKYFKKDEALSRRFERVTVDEPLVKEIYPMIKNKISSLSEYHGVKISRNMVDFSILIANCFAFDKKNPDKTLDLIDRSMVVASRAGKKQVSKDHILKNFEIYFELYEGMGEEARRMVAYHEAGHYIVGKISKRLVEFNWLAISILPANDYLGITCFEISKDKVPFSNKQYYIDLLASDLGGRAAEQLYVNDVTSGAEEDLEKANKRAFNVITKYGMSSEGEIRNNIFLNTTDYPMFSEKSKNMVYDEVKELVDIAYERARTILDENSVLLEKIVDSLMKKRIMSEIELDEIWKQYLKA